MNILFLTPRGSEKNLGGVEGHIRLLTEELERRGHEVRELSLSDIEVKENKDKRRLGKEEEKINKIKAWIYLWKKRDLFRWAEVVHIHDVFWWYAPFSLLSKFRLLGGSLNLLNKVVGSDPNLRIHPNYTNKKSFFVTFHGWEGVCPPTKSAVWQKRLAAKLSRGTIGVGSFYEKWYRVKPDKIVWGVLPQKINNGRAFKYKSPALGALPRQDLTLAFLGRLEEVNGIETVMRALKVGPWRALRSDLFRFVFVGDGSYRKQAEKFGKVTGMMKDPEKYLVDADVIITSSYMSMLEAAARGKSVIAVANNELKEDYLGGHPLRKYIKVVKNADELIRVIKGLYKVPTLDSQGRDLKDLRSVRLWALKQTPEKLADDYESLWKTSIN